MSRNIFRSTGRWRTSSNERWTGWDANVESDPDNDDNSTERAVDVERVELRVEKNTEAHHTAEYENINEGKLVVRRGQHFDFDIFLKRDFDKKTDHVKLVFETGKRPMLNKGSRCEFMLSGGAQESALTPNAWSAVIKPRDSASDDKRLSVRVQPAHDSVIGTWSLQVFTRHANLKKWKRYRHADKFYLLFNPWCEADETHMDEEIERDEYVLNDVGKIYSGNFKQPGSKPWIFGQFEDFMLDLVFYLLEEKLELREGAMRNPALIARSLSKIVNEADDKGILIGNWSGVYSGGTRPTKWAGSVQILRQFWQTKQPVKFGQCWVFSGVTTTLLRCIGIGARSVTNFKSGHDCDGSATLDRYFYTYKGQTHDIPKYNRDSVWNFHVWNECWMARSDLPPGNGGWQVVDSTPQEASDGVYQCGPFPVCSIKEGRISLNFDGAFIFAEMNADRINWTYDFDDDKPGWKIDVVKDSIGKRLCTKRPRKYSTSRDWELTGKDQYREDITNTYKHKPGTEEARAAVYRANTRSTFPGLYGQKHNDVKVELEADDNILVGSSFPVYLKLQNTSREKRHVKGSLELRPVYYTGLPCLKNTIAKQLPFDVELGPIKAEEIAMHVAFGDYEHLIVEQVQFLIVCLASVAETRQTIHQDEEYRLRIPVLIVQSPDECNVGQEIEVSVTFKSSWPGQLTGCEFSLEGAGICDALDIPHRDIEAYEEVTVKAKITARKRGSHSILATFESDQLHDVTGAVDIDVN